MSTDELLVGRVNSSNVHSKKNESPSSFPHKLHRIIERSEIEGYSQLVQWAPHGRAFRIHNEYLFIEKIARRFFFLTKVASFKRQLSLWGFRRICQDTNPDKGAYYHELFLKGREELCQWFVRSKKPIVSDSQTEPNFYRSNFSLFREHALIGSPQTSSVPPPSVPEVKSKELKCLPTKPYRDYLKITDEEAVGNFKPRLEVFPMKLHRIIERAEIDGFSDIVSWQSHGRAFRIHNEALFMKKIVFQYFFMQKLLSFKRQLSIWGFKKVTRNPKNLEKKGKTKTKNRKFSSKNEGGEEDDVNCYYHEMFLRGRPGLCVGISRLAKRSLVEPDNEPCFKNYDPMPKLIYSSNLVSPDRNALERKVIYLQEISFSDEKQSEEERNCDTIITDVRKKGEEFNDKKMSIAAVLVSLSKHDQDETAIL